MIKKYEVHIDTKYTLYELLNVLKSKGIGVDFKLKSGDCGELHTKFPNSETIDIFDFKFYKHDGERYIYEIGSHKKEDLVKMEDIGQSLE